MATIHQTLMKITTLEELSKKNTPLHSMSVITKIMITLIYIIVVVSFPQGDLDGILIYACYPVLLIIIGEIPIRTIMIRCITALPFVIFAGLSQLIYNRDIAFQISFLSITKGEIAMITLLLKTILTVMAVLILVATTGISKLSYGLSSLHLPAVFVMQLMMTYRYLGLIAEEAATMYQAYQLRAPKEKGIRLQDYGKFIGRLVLRSFDRAERVYHSMLCRGFQGQVSGLGKDLWSLKDIIILLVAIIPIIILRFINLGEIIGQFIIRLY